MSNEFVFVVFLFSFLFLELEKFEKAVKRFSEAKDVLEKFEKSEEAVAFMQNETGLPADECMRAYELIMNTDTD